MTAITVSWCIKRNRKIDMPSKKSTLLKQALKLRQTPTFSEVKELIRLAREYQSESGELFLLGKRGERVRLLDEAAFFRFLSETLQIPIHDFDTIERALNAQSRAENIAATGDSKSTQIAPFAKTLLLRFREELPTLYREAELKRLSGLRRVVAVENAETFLAFEALDEAFDTEAFVYLGGQPNALTRRFLQSREVLFFIDWDIVSLNFYEDFDARGKGLYLPDDFDALLTRYGNAELYLKQRYALRASYLPEVAPIVEKLQEEAKVLEQEIWHDPRAAH